MMRTEPKSYFATYSSRRETAGLMGAFIVFMLGLPSHSASVIESSKHLARQLIQLVLVFLGLATPAVQAPTGVAAITSITPRAVVSVKPRHALIKVDPNSMRLRSDPILHRFTYVFDGKATYHGEPSANTSVLIRLISGDRNVTKGTVTDTDGSYSVEIAIDAEDKAPVDWVMEAYTADFQKVELSGRRIVQREEEQELLKQPIIVTNPVNFVISLSK